MIATGERNLDNLSFSCNIDGKPEEPFIKSVRKHPQCKFLTFLVDCKTTKRPTSFYLAGPNQEKHNVSLEQVLKFL
jgi:hypothetical protein